MLTNDKLKELLEDGTMGLDLSPGNNLYKRAHDEIIDLRADLKAMQAVVKASQDFCMGKTTTTRFIRQALAVLAALDAKPGGEG